MSVVEPGSGSTNLVERVKNIILKPAETWDQIAGEPATVQSLFLNYACILAAIPAIAGFIGLSFIGAGFGFFSMRIGIVPGLLNAVIGYVLGLVMVFILGLIIEALAPSFDGQKDRLQAMKVAVYSMTPGWVAGVLAIVPMLGLLIILASLYGVYVLYLGLPRLMKAPQEKSIGYTAVIIVIAIVISVVIGAVLTPIRMMSMGNTITVGANSHAVAPGSVKVGGIDVGALEAQSKKMEAAAKQMESGEGPAATDPEVLKAYLPAQVAGFARQEVSSSSGGVGGMNGSQAEGKYARGDASITLTVTDMGAAGAIAGMAGALGVRGSSESDGHYEKMGKVDGRTTMEEFDRDSGHGKYTVLAGDRFMIEAEGQGARIEELKAAVQAANPARLEALARNG